MIGGRADTDFTTLCTKPCPTRAKAARTSVLEFRLEGIKRSESFVNGFGQSPAGSAAAIGTHHRPKQRVVVVPASIVADRTSNGLRQSVQISAEIGHRMGSQIIMPFKCCIELGDVASMVFAMVNFHGSGIDGGF